MADARRSYSATLLFPTLQSIGSSHPGAKNLEEASRAPGASVFDRPRTDDSAARAARRSERLAAYLRSIDR